MKDFPLLFNETSQQYDKQKIDFIRNGEIISQNTSFVNKVNTIKIQIKLNITHTA